MMPNHPVNAPPPVITVELFPELLDELIRLLSGLQPEQWELPTVCAGWSVKDIAAHLLGGEVGILSRKRDAFSPSGIRIDDWPSLAALVNHLNATWVAAARRISPRLLCDLLRFTGEQVCAYFRTLDPDSMGEPVSWAGPEPAPVWLDLAREYTERWHHQQQIRDATDRPALYQPRYFAPVLETFARALPATFRNVEAVEGAVVALTVTGDAGGRWLIRRQASGWSLIADSDEQPLAEVTLPQDAAWRLFTRGLKREAALDRSTIIGDRSLGLHVLETTAIIA